MTGRYLTTRDPVVLKSVGNAPPWFPPTLEVEARVAVVLGRENDFSIVVQVTDPSLLGFGEDVGFHLALIEPGAKWRDTAVVEVRQFHFPPNSPARHEGVVGDGVEGLLSYERRPFELAEVFAEAETGGGSRLIDSAELSQLVDYARARESAVIFVETYELRGELEVPRIDLGIYGLDGEDAALNDIERIDLAARYVAEVLALAKKEDHRFGFRAWVG